MAEISESYASPGLRHGLLLEDHPAAEARWSIRPGTEVGIPVEQGGNDDFVVCEIVGIFDEATGKERPPAVGYKALSSAPKKKDGSPVKFDHPSDQYHLNCTKALGRALKRAGYPDDLDDLRSLVTWRKRNVELEALLSGKATLELMPSDPEKALLAAGRSDPEHESLDGENAMVEEAVEVLEEPEVRVVRSARKPGKSAVPVDGVGAPVSDETKAELREAINGLGRQSSLLTSWARTQGFRISRPRDEAEARALVVKARELAGQQVDVDAAPSAVAGDEKGATIAELVAGLDPKGAAQFAEFCKSVKVDPDATWAKLPVEVADELLAWLSVG
jgi:hypothetical protein